MHPLQLQQLRSLRLRLPYLSRRSIWLDVATLSSLTSLRVDVDRCAPGSRCAWLLLGSLRWLLGSF